MFSNPVPHHSKCTMSAARRWREGLLSYCHRKSRVIIVSGRIVYNFLEYLPGETLLDRQSKHDVYFAGKYSKTPVSMKAKQQLDIVFRQLLQWRLSSLQLILKVSDWWEWNRKSKWLQIWRCHTFLISIGLINIDRIIPHMEAWSPAGNPSRHKSQLKHIQGICFQALHIMDKIPYHLEFC